MENETFTYTYSTAQQAEVRRIREKYLPAAEDKMEQLRRLDRSVTRKGTAVSLVLGVVGALLLGFGMSCTMVWQGVWFIPGIAIGAVGLLAVSLAYPCYRTITEKERAKAAPEILRLSEELLR